MREPTVYRHVGRRYWVGLDEGSRCVHITATCSNNTNHHTSSVLTLTIKFEDVINWYYVTLTKFLLGCYRVNCLPVFVTTFSDYYHMTSKSNKVWPQVNAKYLFLYHFFVLNPCTQSSKKHLKLQMLAIFSLNNIFAM